MTDVNVPTLIFLDAVTDSVKDLDPYDPYRMFLGLPDPESFFQFNGHEPIYFIENKEKTLRASYDRDTQMVDYMD
jgi:hypothetical protein